VIHISDNTKKVYSIGIVQFYRISEVKNMKEVVIVSAARTAIGSFGGSLAGVSAVDLGITAAKGAIERAGIDASLIDEAVIGNVLGAGLGQNIARQVILGAGLPNTTPAFSINKVCGSGLRTVELAAQIIKAGDADIILAGGTESMSNAPYLVKGARFGVKMADFELIGLPYAVLVGKALAEGKVEFIERDGLKKSEILASGALEKLKEALTR